MGCRQNRVTAIPTAAPAANGQNVSEQPGQGAAIVVVGPADHDKDQHTAEIREGRTSRTHGARVVPVSQGGAAGLRWGAAAWGTAGLHQGAAGPGRDTARPR